MKFYWVKFEDSIIGGLFGSKVDAEDFKLRLISAKPEDIKVIEHVQEPDLGNNYD
jgi:hypothetical protein